MNKKTEYMSEYRSTSDLIEWLKNILLRHVGTCEFVNCADKRAQAIYEFENYMGDNDYRLSLWKAGTPLDQEKIYKLRLECAKAMVLEKAESAIRRENRRDIVAAAIKAIVCYQQVLDFDYNYLEERALWDKFRHQIVE